MKPSTSLFLRVILVGVLTQSSVASGEEESLHSLIDRRLNPVAGLAPGRCSDAEFLRRVSLDLIGMPPSADEARAFITDPAPDKRERLVDRLLASPHYARHLATTLDVMLMERRGNTHVSADEWQAWLLRSVRENKPWNVLAREILSADGDDPAQRAAARFALDRGSESHLLTRDIGRIFFGKDLQCAQCHDHPLIEGYLQSDYHGLLAFVAPSYALERQQGDKKITLYAELAGTDLSFQSVFIKDSLRRTGARMPDDVVIEEPFFFPGDEYQVAPAANVKSVPKFSRRAKLAELATNGSNRAFNENIVNRLWAHMFGRGLVHPLDLHHSANPPIDPELLRILAQRFAAMNFDMKAFLREVALSEVYQRSFDPPTDLLALSAQAASEVTQLEQRRAALEQTAESSRRSFMQAWDAWDAAQTALLPAAGELDTARTQYAEAKKKVDEAAAALAAANAQLNAKQSVATTVQQAATAAQQAAQALPEDKELADAAQKFVARSQQLTAEVEALKKTVEEKTAALKAPTDALNTVKGTVEAALAKTKPLTDAVKQAEQAMLAARRKATADAEALGALDQRMTTLRQIVELPKLNEAIVSATQTVSARQTELATARKALEEYTTVIAQQQAGVKAAMDALNAAAEKAKIAREAHAKREGLAKAITTALASAENASKQAPEDPVLVEVVGKLKARATVAQTELSQSQKQVDETAAAQKAASEALANAQKVLAEAVADRTRREQAVNTLTSAVATAQADVSAKEAAFDTAVGDLTQRWTNDFTLAPLKPLTPEQLCWSVFRVTGVYDRYWQAEVAELDKAKPLTDEQKKDPAQLAARGVELEQRTFDKLKGNVGTFITYYGAGAGQPQGDFFATADQALFSANGGSINSWVAPAGDNVTNRIIQQTDLRVAAEELYLGVLTRMPTEAETKEVVAYLTNRSADKNVAAQELVWSLLNSAEFRFNH